MAATGQIKLLAYRVINRPQFGNTLANPRHADTKMGDAAGKVGGAIDGIHHPQALRAGRLAGGLFAEDQIVRERPGKGLQNLLLNEGIGLGQEILMALQFILARFSRPEEAQGSIPGVNDNAPQRGFPLFNIMSSQSVLPVQNENVR